MQETSKRVTLRDVAERASVSQATVSYVLNRVAKHTIPEATREAVVRAARELGYRPNRSARALVSGINSTVICVVPAVQLSDPILTLLGELTLAFARRDIVLTVHFDKGDGELSLATLEDRLQPRTVFSLVTPRGEFDFESGLVDPGSELQVEHLVGRGHHQLAFAAPKLPMVQLQSRWRKASVKRVAERHGIKAIAVAEFEPDGSNAAEIILHWAEQGVTAVCAYSDEVASAVLHGIRKAGMQCPRDLAVIGYDATLLGKTLDPPLTSISWDGAAVATSLVDEVLDQASGAPSRAATVHSVRIAKGQST